VYVELVARGFIGQLFALHPLMGKRRQEQIDRALACFSQQRADQRGAYNHKTRLSELQVLDIYRRACAGENRAAIAREYGVHHMTVQDIYHGQNWSWLTGAVKKIRKQ
jgi:hypothetical protein